jgi:hypothetical protein
MPNPSPSPSSTAWPGVPTETSGGHALVRPLLKSRARIIEVMAEDMRNIAATRGSVDAADLKLAGWTAAQITLACEDAASRAHLRAGSSMSV